MAEITDIEKLNPELLKLSPAEIKRRMTELQMALNAKEEQEKAAVRAKLVEEAGVHIDNLLDSLRWLEANKFLPDSVVAFFTTSGDKPTFVPHLKFKKPRV